MKKNKPAPTMAARFPIRFSVTFSKSSAGRLGRECNKQGVSKTLLIRRAVDFYLDYLKTGIWL